MKLNQNERVPQAYIDGRVLFHDLSLKVSKDCLIPRQESELLVERALKRFSQAGDYLDLCTGSGALGLSIKKLRPQLNVTLSDVSKEALSLVKENAKENSLDVEIVEGDFLKPFTGRIFDGIICNPPYITEEQYKTLDPSVRDFEPKLALVGGEDGLEFYRRLASEVLEVLKPGGVVCLEIGKDQALSVAALFSDEQWEKKLIEKDYSGHDRFFFIEKREWGL